MCSDHCKQYGHRVFECPHKQMESNRITMQQLGQSFLQPAIERVSTDVSTLNGRLAATNAELAATKTELAATRLEVKTLQDLLLKMATSFDAEVGRIKEDLEKLGNPPEENMSAASEWRKMVMSMVMSMAMSMAMSMMKEKWMDREELIWWSISQTRFLRRLR
ncbi:Hypothetical protein TPAR_09481 [Tolypocladium paradoxum]|uniref:Uncharacterized protein n=1 Tax=Tolypocladium paradoxum TaxID=94208 RepID=A0A2S4KR49_9HYPO|nr:Hypothetical protein TPAR_09481 [Tolypocladium paradoxum]